MRDCLRQATPYAEAFVRLLHPHAEVVIHDLQKGQIEAIYNPISRREVGDDSYLDRIDFDTHEAVIGPYDKRNWDGAPLKSISVVLRDGIGKPVGCLCVNVSLSAFHSVQKFLDAWLNNGPELSEHSQQLFRNDLYERVNQYVDNYCRDHQVSVEALSRTQKQRLVNDLAADGAFEGKNAANYIGRVLGISRATVYNYLKETP